MRCERDEQLRTWQTTSQLPGPSPPSYRFVSKPEDQRGTSDLSLMQVFLPGVIIMFATSPTRT